VFAAKRRLIAKAMAEALTFLMGKYPAVLPGDLRYARNHMWCRVLGETLRFGFTSYAVRLMKDVYFLDWTVSAGDVLALRQQIGHIETSKAESDLFAPIAGMLLAFNQELLNDPSPINTATYEGGWLFEMEGDTSPLMTVAEYYTFLEAGWENTQRILKGQV
jgi:glycine cleavage system H protein